MLKDDLKCVLIGRDIEIYRDLARLVKKIDPASKFKQVDLKESTIVNTLKKIKGPSLIFISDEVPFSLELLSDLTWQYNADAIVVILTTKARTVSIKELFNNTQFSRINLSEKDSHSSSILQFLIKSTKEKSEFRRCKSLLGISEKRCQWLVDSSREAIAYISRDIHWYANTTYLELFGISSVQELRSTSIKDLIVQDEHLLFDGFQKNQGKPSDDKKSLMLSMKKQNGSTFRANIYLIPSVFKGHKCHQLWVSKINDLLTEENDQQRYSWDPILNKIESSKPIIKEENGSNPFTRLLKEEDGNNIKITTKPLKVERNIDTNLKQKSNSDKTNPNKYNQTSLLRGVIRRKEAKLITTPLHFLKKDENRNKKILVHNMVSLKVAVAQKKGVDDLLSKLPESFNNEMRSVFWDKVKFSRVLQSIVKKEQLPTKLLLKVNEASINDESFIEWLIPGLKRLGNKTDKLIFLIPSNVNEQQYKKNLLFIKKLRTLGCEIALDSFTINRKSLILLRYAKPEYIRLSLPWTRQLQGNEQREIRLSSAIRQLENKKIKVIAPCGFSNDMKRLFILSGASFCQERAIKTV